MAVTVRRHRCNVCVNDLNQPLCRVLALTDTKHSLGMESPSDGSMQFFKTDTTCSRRFSSTDKFTMQLLSFREDEADSSATLSRCRVFIRPHSKGAMAPLPSHPSNSSFTIVVRLGRIANDDQTAETKDPLESSKTRRPFHRSQPRKAKERGVGCGPSE